MRALALLSLTWALTGCYLSHERAPDAGDRDAGPARPRIVELSAGGDHTCARTDEGEVRCWGWDQLGQLGVGEGDASSCERRITLGPERREATRVEGITGAVSLAAGLDHSCALLADGTLRCWGAGCRGQLGNGAIDGSEVPVPIGTPDLVLGVGAGHGHTVAITRGETLLSWGWNGYGQLGIGTTSPLAEPGATEPVDVPGLARIVAADLGLAHSCALDRDGLVWCWGANGAGQLGDGTSDVRSVPQPVRGLPGPARALALGDRHTCAIVEGSGVWCWGLNDTGQLGVAPSCAGMECDRERVAVLVGLPDAIGITAGSRHTCALDGEGAVWCWGSNDVGQLGLGAIGGARPTPSAVGLEGAEAITAGQNHTCALVEGEARCWGRNAQGQLGDGAGSDSGTPVALHWAEP